MASGITKPEHAYARLLKAWPAIVDECRAVWGSELHYQAMIYHALRTAGRVPREQLGMNVKIMIPDRYMGDVKGDLTHKRGRIVGIGNENGMQVIEAEIPQAEMFRYSSELRSVTQGQGSFESAFSRYDVVPGNVAQKIVAEAAKNKVNHDDE